MALLDVRILWKEELNKFIDEVWASFFLVEKGCMKVPKKNIIQLPDLPKGLLTVNPNSLLSHSDLIIWLFKNKVPWMAKGQFLNVY